MNFSPNPFFNIIETETIKTVQKGSISYSIINRASRFYRRTFWEKITDTFFVIAGKQLYTAFLKDKVSQANKEDTLYPGLLDYATLFLPAILNFVLYILLGYFLCKNQSPIALVIAGVMAILLLPLNLIYHTTALLLTLALSPIIFGTHLLSQILGGRALQATAGELSGCIINNGSSAGHVKLSDCLKQNGCSYSKVIIDFEKKDNGHGDTTKLLVMINPVKKSCCYSDGECVQQDKRHIIFRANIDHMVSISQASSPGFGTMTKRIDDLCYENDEKSIPQKEYNNKKPLEALFKLNAGGFRDTLFSTYRCAREITAKTPDFPEQYVTSTF